MENLSPVWAGTGRDKADDANQSKQWGQDTCKKETEAI